MNKYHKRYTEQELKNLIIDYIKAKGEPPRQGRWPVGFPSFQTISRHCKSYNQLLIDIGREDLVYKPIPSKLCRELSTISSSKKEHGGHWKGGRSVLHRYIGVWNPSKQWYDQEHRVVMEKYIGRKLLEKEVVHHINFDSHDNRLENLVLCKDEKEHKSKYHSGIYYRLPKKFKR